MTGDRLRPALRLARRLVTAADRGVLAWRLGPEPDARERSGRTALVNLCDALDALLSARDELRAQLDKPVEPAPPADGAP